jgi:hypothetical protein
MAAAGAATGTFGAWMTCCPRARTIAAASGPDERPPTWESNVSGYVSMVTRVGFAARVTLLPALVLLGTSAPGRALPGVLVANPAVERGSLILRVRQVDCSQCRVGGRCPSVCKIDCRAQLKKYQSCNRQCPEYGKRGSRDCNIKCQRFTRGCD